MRTKFVTKLMCMLALAGLAMPTAASAAEKIAIFKIKGSLTEQPDQTGMTAFMGSSAPTNLFELLNTLKEARTDANLSAVIFEIEEAGLGFAQIQELRTQFEALRAADKDVYVYCETLHPGTLLLGSAASKLVLMPRGEVEFAGMYSEGLYFKNMLDKIGVQADILHCGDYKSAGEPFYLTGPSKEAEEQTNKLIDSIFEQIVALIAKSRKLEPEAVHGLMDKAILSAQDALDAKLVDKLAYKEQFVADLKKQYGKDVKFTRKYGKKKGPEIDPDNPFSMFKVFSELMKGESDSGKPSIAVVYVDGPISSGESEPSLFGGSDGARSETVRKAIDAAAKDNSVKALLLRVDSPGGSAIASEVICEATKRFKNSGRPFIVSMGNVAGSGGYYVATMADAIFCQPGSITGSIGVVGGKLVTKGLWDWVGVTGHEYKRGKHADVMNSNRKFTDAEREIIKGLMDRVYGEFKDRVVEGRGKKIKGDLEPLAGGRVYTGKQALDIGLIDQLGGFSDAIKYTADQAQLGSKYELKVFPRPKTLGDILSEVFGGKEDKDDMVSVKAGCMRPGGRFASMPTIATAIEAATAIDPVKAQAIKNFLIQLELLQREGVLLVSPPVIMSAN